MKQKFFNTLIVQTSLLLMFCLLHPSCSVIQKSNKNQFNNGFYIQKIDGKKQKVYIEIVDDTIRIHPTQNFNHKLIIDTTTAPCFFQKEIMTEPRQTTSFDKVSFDIDFFTIPLKFRPNQNDVPSQLNTTLNGAVYFGYRTDKYVLNYIANPLGKSDRLINHFGFSMGVFSGFGNTFMSPTNTNNILQQEYDGIVLSKGLAGIFAFNNITVGLALGFDNLLDKNKKIWIYENKYWLGLTFGLNLN